MAELPSPRRRRRVNQDGLIEAFSDLIRIGFDLESDDDSDDDYEFYEFLGNHFNHDFDTDSEYSDASFMEVLNELFMS